MAKSVKHSIETYQQWKKDLSLVHQFSFRATKHFTPAQKTAISKAHTKHMHTVTNIKQGKAVLKPAKKSQRNNLKDRFQVTNKGIILYGENIKKVRIKGKGKKTTVLIKRPRVTDLYIKKQLNESIDKTISRVFKIYVPDAIVLAVNNYRGTIPYSYAKFKNKYKNIIKNLEEEIIDEHGLGLDESPFNGVYAVFYTD